MRKAALLVVITLAAAAAAQTSAPSATPPATQNQQPAPQNEPEYQGPYTFSPAPEPPRTPPPDSSHPMYPGVNPGSLKAPEPGHELDMRDVMVLTGKDKEGQQGYAPQAYYNYGMPYYGAPNPYFSPYGYRYGRTQIPLLSGGGILSGGSMLDSQPRFAPLLFGNAGGRPFFVVGDSGQLNPSAPFLFPGGLIAPFQPVSPMFTFGSFVRPLQFGSHRSFNGTTSRRARTTSRTRR